MYIGEKRVRARIYKANKNLNYYLDKNKAMYYDYELEEDEFFNPKIHQPGSLYDLFNNPNLLENLKFQKKKLFNPKKKGVNEKGSYI